MNTTAINQAFKLFKCLAFGEVLTIVMVLLAYLYTFPEYASLSPMTTFPYYAMRTFGTVMIPVWVTIGCILAIMFGERGDPI